MFTGIVQGVATIVRIEKKPGLHTITVSLPPGSETDLQRGASIALNGTCLTITEFEGNQVCFDVMLETLRATNLATFAVGDSVNFERAARMGEEIGGHLLSGHIHAVLTVSKIEAPENNRVIHLDTPAQWLRYILPKGYVALNGASLTVGQVTDRGFCVYLIPETLAITTFGDLQVGDQINLEVDSLTQAVVTTVERLQKQENSQVSAD